jgi:subtilisin family serine protease
MKKLIILAIIPIALTLATPARIHAAQDTTCAIVQFQDEPLSTSVKTKPAQGKKIDFNSNTVKAYRAQLNTVRNNFKAWLKANAPAAKVTGEFDIALNAVSVSLNGTSLATLQQAQNVKSVDYENLYHLNASDPDLGLINAIEAWQQGGGAAHAGEGVKVAIIDTGIDIHHPCFDDTGYPQQKQLGDRRFTNNKVIVAKVFNNRTVSFGYTAEAIAEHGTHVAGTVACNSGTPAVVNGVSIPYGISGVAPRALLGNYNVFPADVADARDEDIFDALEEAYRDGFDVANMSLGGGYRGVQDLVMAAVDRLDKANMVVAIAAGNSGPGYQTIESPGAASRALTAGASTVGHYVGSPVTVNGHTYGAASGDFATVSSDLTAPLAVVTQNGSLGTACAALPAGSLAGKIALISRGTCSFSAKIRNAQAAGAVAVLMVNNVVGDPIAMGQDGTPNQPTIPAYMLSRADGISLLGANGSATTISASFSYFQTANSDIMASFSGWGPTLVDFRIKPDVVAPGVNVLSSIPLAFCGGKPCWAFFQGTSMSSPHLAGSAAIVHWLYPDWDAATIRSAIVNTADDTTLKNFINGAPFGDVNVVGAGRENLLAAVNAAVALDPVSVSFGAVPTGSGQTKPFSVTVSNLRAATSTYSFAVTPGDASVAYWVSPTTATIAAGKSTSVTVYMSAAKGAVLGGHHANLTVKSGSLEVAHAVVYTLIK